MFLCLVSKSQTILRCVVSSRKMFSQRNREAISSNDYSMNALSNIVALTTIDVNPAADVQHERRNQKENIVKCQEQRVLRKPETCHRWCSMKVKKIKDLISHVHHQEPFLVILYIIPEQEIIEKYFYNLILFLLIHKSLLRAIVSAGPS